MRWLFVALVAVNLVYPAWKLVEASRAPKAAGTSAAPVRTGERLVLLREAEAPRGEPAARAAEPMRDARVMPEDEAAGAGASRGERSAQSSETAEAPAVPGVDSPVLEASAAALPAGLAAADEPDEEARPSGGTEAGSSGTEAAQAQGVAQPQDSSASARPAGAEAAPATEGPAPASIGPEPSE